MSRRVWMLGCALLLATPVHAEDGRTEINQHCATQTGCRAGDGAGFPVSTQAGKSYVLTSSLVVASAETAAVNLAAGASLDLNGFSITGPAVCTGTPPSCVGLGAGRGVVMSAGGSVRNGRIAGMGGDGIAATAGARLDHLLVEANGDDGIDADSDAIRIADCRILRNKDEGVEMTSAAPHVIERTTVFGNGTIGVDAVSPLIVDSAIYGNASYGIDSLRLGIGSSALFQNNGGAGNPQLSGFVTVVSPSVCDGGAC